MVAHSATDARDSHVVEIEFHDSVPQAEIISFINSVNNRTVPLLADAEAPDGVLAGFAFEGTPALADVLQPRRDRFVAVRVPADKRSDDAARLLMAQYPGITAAARRPIFIPATTSPSDPLIGTSDQRPPGSPPSQWYIHRCDANKVWFDTLGAGVVVADIDWGFRLSHQDLTGRYDPTGIRNVLDGTNSVSTGDDLSHGTGAAGLIGAGANGAGIAGLAPECTLWLLQAGIVRGGQAEQPPGVVNPWATAIEWVVDKTSPMPKVINVEFQSGIGYSAENSIAVQGAVRRAVAAGAFVCIPAGNGDIAADSAEGGGTIPNTGSIVVAATGYDPTFNPRALKSNHGARVNIAAPGDSALDLTCGASDTGYTEAYGGTSGASAKVAGALALVLSRNTALTLQQLLVILAGLPPNVFSQVPIGKFLQCKAIADAAFGLRAPTKPSVRRLATSRKNWARLGNKKPPNS